MGNFKEDIARCEAFVFDVDGVMTDGGIIPTPDGDFIRRYNAKDGYALAYAIKIGYKVCIITGGRGRTLENRLRMLGIDHFYVDCMDKITAIREYMAGQGLDPANVLTGGWLNLSFWYKREERTSLAIVVTGAGLVAIVAFGFWLIPLWGYYGAAWARLASETVMVAVSWWLNRRYYPTPYDWRRIGEYVAAALAVFAVCEALTASADNMFVSYAFNIVLFALYAAYLVRRERIDLGAMLRAFLHR